MWQPPQALPGFTEWRATLSTEMAYPAQLELGQDLLEEVVWAAARVERSLQGLIREFDAGQAMIDKAYPQREPAEWDDPPLRSWFSGSEFTHASDHWVTLVWWVRAFQERMIRPARRGTTGPRGLIPALADGAVKEEIARRFEKLVADHLMDVRWLANFSLHHRKLPHGSGARVTSESVLIPIPDRLTGPVDFSSQLSYRENRDARRQAVGVFEAIAEFVDFLLETLEAETSRVRSGRSPADRTT
jgi:hypothetical protein